MKRISPKKSAKATAKSSALNDLRPTKAGQVKAGGKMVVNTHRYDPYKAAKF